LYAFSNLALMTVHQVKTFNALMILISILLGANMTSSLKEYALMLRWRIMAAQYRPLEEFDLLMHIESIRKVVKLFWIGRTRGQWSLNRTQVGCLLWLAVNILLQVLVALLGLTYNLGTSDFPDHRFGKVSIANMSVIRDFWTDANPSYSAQLGSANYYGIQGQDYNFVNNVTVPGQGKIGSFGTPSTPTIYSSEDRKTMTYYFQDQNPDNLAITLLSRRHISMNASCRSFKVIAGGNGIESTITYLDENDYPTTLNVVRVGPGAMTFVSMLNSTCGPRCAEIMALQSMDNKTISYASFFKCKSTMSLVEGLKDYVQKGQNASIYQLQDEQAKIMAGAIGWTGFNYTPGDQLQYVRYSTDSWWSPNEPTKADTTAEHIMEFSMEAIAALDFNGPRQIVAGWHPITAQKVNLLWQWAGAILGVIPFLQLLVLLCVVKYAKKAIIKDDSCLSTARLLRPLVEKLGPNGCLLTGKEIAEEFPEIRLKYGYREPTSVLEFHNQIEIDVVRHVDLIEEHEGLGRQDAMPPGRYDGLLGETQVSMRKKLSIPITLTYLDEARRRVRLRLRNRRVRKSKPE
jgi:hypothetical protein